MPAPTINKPRLLDARCPHCYHLLFKAAEDTQLTALIEIKCSNCGTMVTYRPGKLPLTVGKVLSKD